MSKKTNYIASAEPPVPLHALDAPLVRILHEQGHHAYMALQAVKARLDGVFDDVALVGFGPLSVDPKNDIDRIVAFGMGATPKKASTQDIVKAMRAMPTKEEPELNEASHCEWMGYHIKRKLDFGEREKDKIGYVVTDSLKLCNVMPGACWFESVADARKGIAAHVLARAIKPPKDELIKGADCDGDIFWMLMELSRVGKK